MHPEEFVRRFKKSMEDSDSRFAFFIGSGCSVSSGIPDATKLVKQWLPRIKKLRTGSEENLEKWIKEEFPEYKGDNAALYYGKAIEALFLTHEERQKEIERITEGKDPSFGYAVLAQLMSNENYGRHCNIILTTNFDDMAADALYLYTNKKPLIISHESLIGFVRISRMRPLILKLHGDARLAPKNTKTETEDLDEAVKKVLKNLLSEVGLVFIGYGGNDKSIATLLNELHPGSLPWGVWWIGSKMPDNEMGQWLKERNAKWINHHDFDELMLLLWNEFQLKHPERERFDMLVKTYFETFKKLKDKVEAEPTSNESEMLKVAVEKAAGEVKDWWSVYFEASKIEKTDPLKADKIYRDGLKKYPSSPNLNGNYAIFFKR